MSVLTLNVGAKLKKRGIDYEQTIELMRNYESRGRQKQDDDYLTELYHRCNFNIDTTVDVITICGTLLEQQFFNDDKIYSEYYLEGFEIVKGQIFLYTSPQDDPDGVDEGTNKVINLLDYIENIVIRNNIEFIKIVECKTHTFGRYNING